MPLDFEKQQSLVTTLIRDVDALHAYADEVDEASRNTPHIAAEVNARLDACFTRCQALLDDMNRFQQPLLYHRLLQAYRKLFALFQRWD